MTDRTILKKIFGCKDNGIDFITGLDEAIFEEAFCRMIRRSSISTKEKITSGSLRRISSQTLR